MRRDWRAETETDQEPCERAAREATGAHIGDEVVDVSIVHEVVLLPVAVGRPVSVRCLAAGPARR
jgi:hypothetical protein